MIVIGVDAHKSSHTCAAVQALMGQTVATRAVAAREHGLGVAHAWARELMMSGCGRWRTAGMPAGAWNGS